MAAFSVFTVTNNVDDVIVKTSLKINTSAYDPAILCNAGELALRDSTCVDPEPGEFACSDEQGMLSDETYSDVINTTAPDTQSIDVATTTEEQVDMIKTLGWILFNICN